MGYAQHEDIIEFLYKIISMLKNHWNYEVNPLKRPYMPHILYGYNSKIVTGNETLSHNLVQFVLMICDYL